MNTTTTQTQATEDPRCCPATLKVGDGATTGWGDSYPATVIAISADRRKVTIQMDKYRVVSGSCHDGSAAYEYEADPNGATYVCRYYKRNRSRNAGFRATDAHGCGVFLGERCAYYNPHV